MGVAAVVGGAGDDDFGRREFGVQAERVRQLGVGGFLLGANIADEDTGMGGIKSEQEVGEGGFVGDVARLLARGQTMSVSPRAVQMCAGRGYDSPTGPWRGPACLQRCE